MTIKKDVEIERIFVSASKTEITVEITAEGKSASWTFDGLTREGLRDLRQMFADLDIREVMASDSIDEYGFNAALEHALSW